MNNPLVSIIIPTYNRAHLIDKTLDSVLAQTYSNWECIIIDDGSDDNTKEVVDDYVKKDSRFQYHDRPTERPRGGNAARNYGFEMSKGAYVNWLDSDDLIADNHLDLHISIHRLDDKINATVSNGRIFTVSEKKLGENWSNIVPKENCILEMINEKVLWPIGGVIWSRCSINSVMFYEDLFSSQEWTFHLLQLIRNKISYKIINKDTYFIRKHDVRIGRSKNVNKIRSTFKSRLYVYKSLIENDFTVSKYESKLVDRFVKSIRDSLANKHYILFLEIYGFVLFNVFRYKKSIKILIVLFFWVPFYFITKKGSKYFSV